MKKILIFISIVVLFITLYGCTKKSIDNDKISTINDAIIDKSDDEIDSEYEVIPFRKGENKMVVSYCTFSGYTKKVAKMIENYYHKKGTVVDLYEIEPMKPYTEKDLDYTDKNSRCSIEYHSKSRPELLDNDFNIDKHEVIFLGFPVWWGESPQILYTFLESYDFTGKTIVPFCTSHSSPLGTACENLKNYTTANVLDGIRFSMEVKEEEVEKWLDELNLK